MAKAIDELVNEGRKVFEQDQTITDNLKSLIPARPVVLIPVKAIGFEEYVFDLANIDYLFYIRASITTKVNTKLGKAGVTVTQHDDIETILDDPYNLPKPYKVPVTFARSSITAYATPDFSVENMHLTYVKKPLSVSVGTNCDIDSQLHYIIVDRAVSLAAISLGITKQ